MAALAATSLVTGPALAEPGAACELRRTGAHHSEGVDTWNAAYPRPTRPLDAVMVFLSFPDSAPLTAPAELTADYFPATSQFFERASYGRFTLRPHALPGWIRMPHASTSYAMRRDWNAEHRAAYLRDALSVADGQVDFSRYDVVYFVADPDAPGVDSDATKVVNLDAPLRADGKDIRRVVTVFEKHPPDHLVLAHETGHVFDLPDLYHRPTDGKGDWDTYVGDWDLMGSQFGLAPDLFAWHKWRLGWLDPHQVVCVRSRGSTRLTLEPLGVGPAPAAAAGATPTPEAAAGSASAAGVETVAGVAPVVGAEPVAGVEPVVGAEPVAGVEPVVGAKPVAGVETVAGAGSASPGAGLPGAGISSDAVPHGPEVPAPATAFGVGRGTKLAVVRTGPDSALAFEARGPVGNDGSTCSQGILVYRVRSEAESGAGPVQVVDAHPHSESCWGDSVYPPLADAPVGLGESFTVPGEDVKVEVEDRTPSGAWTVQIATG